MTLAGLPTAIDEASMYPFTIDPEPMIDPSQIYEPGKMMQPSPMKTFRSMTTANPDKCLSLGCSEGLLAGDKWRP